ncbi:putative fatty acid desaturase [Lyophyllum shimeji]|uniref:Fatty acid desaturase n=1 Tax=Lyophyllum shimeji TaxID=47721 RepID=A0A9P3URA2_LYOSH|nr:putative fatty acid desaturase [Lyophyllum shimeji]
MRQRRSLQTVKTATKVHIKRLRYIPGRTYATLSLLTYSSDLQARAFLPLRHLAFTCVFCYIATQIDVIADTIAGGDRHAVSLRDIWYGARSGYSTGVGRGYVGGIWCLGHEAGHEALSPYPWVNAVIGIAPHLCPNAILRLARDPSYPPFLWLSLYLIHNRKGNPRYAPWTSHFKPSSLLFKPEQRRSIVISNIAIGVMITLLAIYTYKTSWSSVWCYYFLPWLVAHNWIVMFTYLQHSDPTIPYYRKDQWTFARGALATVDDLCLAGSDVFSSTTTDHVAHHFFATVPFYNLPQVTEAIRPVLGEYYNYDSTPVLYALWRSFTQCTFVEDEGTILFFKNQYGDAVIELST